MNSGTITNQLLDAVQVLVDDAVKNATFDRTVQAIIVKCVSAAQGKYSVKYQGGYFYAYAQDPDVTYTPDMQVYVLIPGNDMNKTKTILGTVDKLGENFISVEEASVFKYIGNNICSDSEEALYGLHSYLVTDNIVLYEYGETPVYSFDINADAANLYLKNSDYLIIAAKFRTNLPPENRVKGNYGLKYTLTFDDPLTGTEVDRSYILDINNMLGMPYNQPVAMRQSAKFRIDKENFKKIKKIELFSEGFVTIGDSSKPADIFVSDIETMGAVLLPADTSSGYVLNLITKQGIYFDENDPDSATRLIEAEIYKNRKIQQVSTEDVAYYWFKANDTIYMGDERYSSYGGNQWELINEYTIEEGTGKRIYKTNKSSIQISKQSISTPESNYKCVVVYRNGSLTLQREITLYNKSSNYTVSLTCSEPALTTAATAALTCTVSGVTAGHTLNYYWSQKLDDDTYYSELATTTTNTYNVNLKQPIQMVSYKCFVKDVTDNKDIGSATIFITRGEAESFNSYYITIDNDMQVFKYDTDGNSPASQTLLNPQSILPLSFTLYDPEGEEISASEIGASNINWIYPTENTMLTNVQTTGVYGEQLNFEIKNKYDPTAVDNTIKLEISYDDKTIRAKANLIFLKEGENGSNGTAYYLKVEPNLSPNTTIKGKVYYYYKDSSHKGFNFTYPSGQFPFKTLFYRDGNLIYDSTGSNNEITPTVSYDFVKRTYTKVNNNLIQDNCNFVISGNDITCVNNPVIGTSAGNYDADVLRCTFQYNGLTWYYMYPIIFIKYNENNSANYEIVIPQEFGFDEVVFTEDGRNPIYRGNNDFVIEVAKSGEKITASEDWSVQGQIYTSSWQETPNLLIKTESSGKKFYSKESYDGNSVTNAYYCVLSEGVDEIAKIHFPIAMYLNTYGNAYINEWNGNAIELNEEGGIILTPQITAGQKENDNTFTGVVAGKAKESTSSTFDEGIFGYNHGERTFELNAEDGSARFGKTGAGQIVISPDETTAHSVIESGNYVPPVLDAGGNITQAGQGLQIDLTAPSITFGSGKFRVDSDGSVHAIEYATTASLADGSAVVAPASVTGLTDTMSTVTDLDNTITKFQVDLDTTSINVPCDSAQKITNGNQYSFSATLSYKGTLVTSYNTNNLTITYPSGVTSSDITCSKSFNNGVLIITFETKGTTLTNLVNAFQCDFYYPASQETVNKKVILTLAPKGANGETGKSIVVDTISYSYCNSLDGQNPPADSANWQANPNPVEGYFTWVRIVTNYKLQGTSTSAGSTKTYTVSYTGSDGEQGISVVSITPLNYLTISLTEPSAPSTDHDNESTYPDPDIDVWTKFMPNYHDCQFYSLEQYSSQSAFPEEGEEGVVYQDISGTDLYYIWEEDQEDPSQSGYVTINTFYYSIYDEIDEEIKYYYKEEGESAVEINKRYRYFTCTEIKYSDNSHTWSTVLENKELNEALDRTDAVASNLNNIESRVGTTETNIKNLQEADTQQNKANIQFRQDIDSNFGKTIIKTYPIYQKVQYTYSSVAAGSTYNSDLIYYSSTDEIHYNKVGATDFNTFWVNSGGDGSSKILKTGMSLWTKTISSTPAVPTLETESQWESVKPQWEDGYAIYVVNVTQYGDNSKFYANPYLLTDYQTIEDSRYQEAVDVYNAMRGYNKCFYNSNGFFVYDQETEDTSSKRIVINQNGINFATRLRFIVAANPNISSNPDDYYVKEKDLNIYYSIANVGIDNYNNPEKYETNQNDEIIIYQRDTGSTGTMGWDTTSAWGIQGNLNLNKIEVINLQADKITDGVLTLGTTKADGKLIIQNDLSHKNFEISTQHFVCPIYNNSADPVGYVYIGQDIGLQVIGSDGKAWYGNELTWTSVSSGTYQNNINYYTTQGDITSIVDSSHEGETISGTVYTCSCGTIFNLVNQKVTGEITFVNNNTNIIKTMTFNFTDGSVLHQGLGFIKG